MSLVSRREPEAITFRHPLVGSIRGSRQPRRRFPSRRVRQTERTGRIRWEAWPGVGTAGVRRRISRMVIEVGQGLRRRMAAGIGRRRCVAERRSEGPRTLRGEVGGAGAKWIDAGRRGGGGRFGPQRIAAAVAGIRGGRGQFTGNIAVCDRFRRRWVTGSRGRRVLVRVARRVRFRGESWRRDVAGWSAVGRCRVTVKRRTVKRRTGERIGRGQKARSRLRGKRRGGRRVRRDCGGMKRRGGITPQRAFTAFHDKRIGLVGSVGLRGAGRRAALLTTSDDEDDYRQNASGASPGGTLFC